MQISIFTDILLSLCNNNERRQNKNKTYRIHEYTLKNTENRKYNISTCIFIIVKEIFFTTFKSSPNIQSMNVLMYVILYTIYADDSKFLLKKRQEVGDKLNVSILNFLSEDGTLSRLMAISLVRVEV